MRTTHKARIERLEAVRRQAAGLILQVSSTPEEAARFVADLAQLPMEDRPRYSLHIREYLRSQELPTSV